MDNRHTRKTTSSIEIIHRFAPAVAIASILTPKQLVVLCSFEYAPPGDWAEWLVPAQNEQQDDHRWGQLSTEADLGPCESCGKKMREEYGAGRFCDLTCRNRANGASGQDNDCSKCGRSFTHPPALAIHHKACNGTMWQGQRKLKRPNPGVWAGSNAEAAAQNRPARAASDEVAAKPQAGIIPAVGVRVSCKFTHGLNETNPGWYVGVVVKLIDKTLDRRGKKMVVQFEVG